MVSDIRKILKEQYDKLIGKRDKLLSIVEDRLKQTQSEDNKQFTDIADIATHNLEDELAMKVASKEIRMIKQIDDALLRIDKKKYGICVNCSSNINIERLKALPFSTLCVKCKERDEKEDFLDNEDYGYGRESEFNYDFSIDDEEDDIKSNSPDHDIDQK